MTDKKTLIAKLRTLLFDDAVPPVTAAAEVPAPKELKGKDGKKYNVDKLEVGGVLQVADDKDVYAPVVAGTYELEDGSVITTADGGVISEIKPAEEKAKPEPKPVAETPEAMRALYAAFAVGTPDDRLANLELVAKSLMEYCFGWQIRQAEEKATADAAIAAYKTSLAGNAAAMQAMFETIEVLANEPDATPAKVTKAAAFKDGKDKKTQSLSTLKDAFTAATAITATVK